MELKKIGMTTISAIVLSFSTLTFAGGPDKTPAAAENPYFFMSIGGNYWKPADPELTWASENDMNNESSRLFTLQPKYDWGVNAKLGYLSYDKKTAFYIAYYYLSAKSRQSIAAGPGNQIFYIIPQENEFIRDITSANITAKYCFHHVEALADQEVWNGHHLSINVFGGMNFAYNNRKIIRVGQGTFNEDNTPGSETSTTVNKFWAIGPEGGTRVTFHITEHFGIYTQFSGAAMAGDVTESAFDTASSNTSGASDSRSLKITRDAQLIPMLSAEGGVKWACPVGHEGRTIDFLVAYRYITFINAFSGADIFNAPLAETNSISYHGLVFNMGFTV